MQFLLALFAVPLLIAAATGLHLTGLPQFHIPVPSAVVVAKCAVIAVLATLGHSLIYIAVLRANAAVVAPMTYVQLLIASALGWVFFDHAPDAPTFAGAALIIAAGLLLWHGQRPREVPETAD